MLPENVAYILSPTLKPSRTLKIQNKMLGQTFRRRTIMMSFIGLQLLIPALVNVMDKS